MKSLKLALPISSKYDSAVFEAVGLQVALGLLSLLNLDGGVSAQVCGIALVAFWGGVAVLIWRHPQSPSRADLELISFGYFLVVIIAFFLVGGIWHLRGVVQ